MSAGFVTLVHAGFIGDTLENMRHTWHNISMQAVVIKQNGRVQRSDVMLDKEITATLTQKILLGETLYPPEGYILIPREIEGEEKLCKLHSYQIRSWVNRNTVVPETGKTLRDILNEARETYRVRKEATRRKMMSTELEQQFHRTLRLRTNLPVRDMFGKTITREDGSLVRKENANLLKIKMDNVQFLAERLMPDVYGKVEKTENKHLIFSLSDLRKAKEERDRGK